MSVNKSVINLQNCDIDRIIVPQGVTLSSTPSLTPIAGSLGYDITTPTQLYISNGTSFSLVSNGPGTNYTAQAPLAATDSNGLIINNNTNVIFLEFADETHPGILRIPVTGTVNMTLGASTAANALKYSLRRIGTEVSGSIDWVGAPCNDGSPGIILSDVFIPSIMRPTATKQFVCLVSSGTTVTYGVCTVDTNGRIILSYQGLTDFPASQNALCYSLAISYVTV